MRFDNLFLFFPKKFAFEEVRSFQDITKTFPIGINEIDEFHYFSSKNHTHFEIEDSLFHQHWLLDPEKKFLLLTYLLERASFQQKSILVLQANKISAYSYLISTEKIIGKYNVLPEYAIKYIGLIPKEGISDGESLSSQWIEEMNLSSNQLEITKFNVENNSDSILEIENISQFKLIYLDRVHEGQVYCLLLEKI